MTKSFSIAAAQSHSLKGDIKANVDLHMALIQIAVTQDVDIIVFPELSLTGYEPEVAKDLTLEIGDPRIAPLLKMSRENGMTIVAGAPVEYPDNKPLIGSMILGPDRSSYYIKNYLHPGEEKFFSQGRREPCVLKIKDEAVAMAICADVDHLSHPYDAAEKGATIYAAGVLMMGGYDEAAKTLQSYAGNYGMAVLMANHSAPTGGYVPAGKSGIWDDKGDLVAQTDESGDSVVIGTKMDGFWSGKVIPA